MAKTTFRKTPVRKKTSKKKSTVFSIKFWLIAFTVVLFTFGIYHYRNAILYYFSFKSDKVLKEDKVAQARIFQILKAHKELTFGFDISQFQGEINWSAIDFVEEKFPLQFVFIRATAGNDKEDLRFDENWIGAKKHHFIRGAYHYYRPNENSIEQAENFIKTVKLQKGDFPPVLDIEKLPENQSIDSLKIGLKRWLKKVDEHYKVRPIIYTGEKYYNDFLKADFPEYTFWVANYNFFVENIKDDWLFWQFTEKATIKGIDGRVDINIYNGTPKMLRYVTISN
ncbi:GH25 family lysozyme [Flavobacterium sp. SUN052]|uniref:GH25 family lysozyme n=1 Tax=Flavobacterium sp. SUN052 TaxID=3002441 RepID=UPI00237E3B23|nr:GH25 family lysozyme [Flavobacterium sp. SUN052]MEC4004380.1 GH25 family lysozyme [Flavobacterium sp. SUN052]